MYSVRVPGGHKHVINGYLENKGPRRHTQLLQSADVEEHKAQPSIQLYSQPQPAPWFSMLPGTLTQALTAVGPPMHDISWLRRTHSNNADCARPLRSRHRCMSTTRRRGTIPCSGFVLITCRASGCAHFVVQSLVPHLGLWTQKGEQAEGFSQLVEGLFAF